MDLKESQFNVIKDLGNRYYCYALNLEEIAQSIYKVRKK